MRTPLPAWAHLILVLLLTGRIWGADRADPTPAAPPVIPQTNAAAIVQARQRAQEAGARGDVPGLVAALNDEANAHLRAHEFDLAEKLLLRALQSQEERAGRDSLPVADALLNLGWFYNNMARYEKAQESLDRCLEIRQRRLGQEAAPVAGGFNAVGPLRQNRGNL